MLSWIRLVEGEGSGIPTALNDCRNTSSTEPTVVQEHGFVTVTLRRREPRHPKSLSAAGRRKFRQLQTVIQSRSSCW
jgi:predicted HTH transcriptional regulator